MIRTYTLSKGSKMPLYEQLYRAIRQDILQGELKGGEKLPSKRVLAEHLSVSKITVETAYAQLLAEGYITSRQRSGYYAEHLSQDQPSELPMQQKDAAQPPYARTPSQSLFPLSVWGRLQRSVLQEGGSTLLRPAPHEGLYALRAAIAAELFRLRRMQVNPEQIVIGAGAEYFYSLLIPFFGRDKIYAPEELGHRKIAQVCELHGVQVRPLRMDRDGILPEALEKSGADILHLSPSHHFPTGAITPVARRQYIMHWLSQSDARWVIEDDYDSEFRFSGLPIPTLQSMDRCGRVIYMNTFSTTLTPSLRISYMILPQSLLPRWRAQMGFYYCAVPTIEQMTLAKFLSDGYFEKHLNRIKKHYRTLYARLSTALSAISDRCTALGTGAGLHLPLKIRTCLSDRELLAGIRSLSPDSALLRSFYIDEAPQSANGCVVLNYADFTERDVDRLIALLRTLPPEKE